ncbi:hypothetical protein EKO04_005813 [Ascochyta lentis]|uniref:Uncharacterized protein n=1 Tax=Ascochyta lentis TaxID=205686 RepID=A0A8H7J132_9PLEO|nr:hypothetical protein EKO04_005813 [Ascochyta lentis]
MYALINTALVSPLLLSVRTSAAAAAADLGSSSTLLSPNFRGGPPTVRFALDPAFAVVGTEAFVAGAGADPRVRPGPSKPSFDCLPQRLPIGGAGWDYRFGEKMRREELGNEVWRMEERRNAEVSLVVGERKSVAVRAVSRC